ncbi:MAG TPA: methionine--tRNA ligase [Polyangiales bacterium]|nr:methionine--tRNA ligase [Polyangiales bacterium]
MSEPGKYKRILVTAALPYANGPAHLGHIAGAYLPPDIYCRYQRLMGRDVVFICGSDEHGVAIMMKARLDGIPPRDIIDRFHPILRDSLAQLGVSFDYYGRTSSATHRETSQAFFRQMAQQNAFNLHTESQLYDEKAQIFLADRFVRGTCPTCQHPDAYGDQCEKCGRTLSPQELIDPRSALTDEKPVLRETTHWYLSLERMQGWLEQWMDSHPDWKPNVLGQARSWLKAGLVDRSMTRDLTWGVPVPEDVAKAAGVDASGKVLYVWFDAPLGYISATREWAEQQGDPERWKLYWQRDDTKLVHFIGKDNIVFHCLIFPAMLHLHGGYVLPDNVPANEFLNLEGQKLSTSRGWAVWLQDALDAFPPDYLRFALLGVLPETKDSDFSWREMQARINELADTFGNLVNRAATFAKRFFDNVVPPLRDPSALDLEMLDALARAPAAIGELIDVYRFRDAGAALMSLARRANKYFNDAAPWATRTSNPAQCANTIHVALQVAGTLSILSEPFLPFTAARMRDMLGIANVRSSTRAEGSKGLGWEDAGRALLLEGQALREPEILVQKIEDSAIQTQLDRLASAAAATATTAKSGSSVDLAYEAEAPPIQFDDFQKLDFRIGRVVSAEPVPKSKKLLRCQVDLGYEVRQVLAGVAEHLHPDELIGKSVVVVANLAPRTMLGLESRGMLLMAKSREGKLVPILADSEPGSTVS